MSAQIRVRIMEQHSMMTTHVPWLIRRGVDEGALVIRLHGMPSSSNDDDAQPMGDAAE